MLNISADLSFTVTPAGSSRGRTGRRTDQVEGRVTGRGQVVTVTFSRTPSLTAPATRDLAGALANQLDDQGLTVRLAGPDDAVIAEMGHRVRSPLWQLPLTRNRAIRVVSVRAALRSLRGPRLFVAALPNRAAQGPGSRRS